ncbi:MAG: hypothetical protein E7664_05315 [Ruminococcaceae bacterium]|nr:hypothetical protein [Oscillospiraceae bacterium]
MPENEISPAMRVDYYCVSHPRVILSGAKRSRNLSEQIASEDQTTGDVVWNLGREGTIPCEIRMLAGKHAPLRVSTTGYALRSD